MKLKQESWKKEPAALCIFAAVKSWGLNSYENGKEGRNPGGIYSEKGYT